MNINKPMKQLHYLLGKYSQKYRVYYFNKNKEYIWCLMDAAIDQCKFAIPCPIEETYKQMLALDFIKQTMKP